MSDLIAPSNWTDGRMLVEPLTREAADPRFPPPTKSEARCPPFGRFTGASAAGNTLSIVTVELHGRPSINFTLTRGFRLPGPAQLDVRQFALAVREFVAAAAIGQVGFRRRFDCRGRGQSSADSWKIEAVMQMIPRLDTTLFTNREVAHWLREAKPKFPASSGDANFGDNEIRALEAALYFAHLGAAC